MCQQFAGPLLHDRRLIRKGLLAEPNKIPPRKPGNPTKSHRRAYESLHSLGAFDQSRPRACSLTARTCAPIGTNVAAPGAELQFEGTAYNVVIPFGIIGDKRHQPSIAPARDPFNLPLRAVKITKAKSSTVEMGSNGATEQIEEQRRGDKDPERACEEFAAG